MGNAISMASVHGLFYVHPKKESTITMAQLPTYAEVLRTKPECLDPNDYSGKVKFLPHWPKIHPDYKPEHLNKPEHRWIFGHPVMILSRGPSDKGNVDVCVLRTFQGRGLQAEHGASLQSRFYLPIHPAPPHPFTAPGHPTIPVLYLINPEYGVISKYGCWVNLKKTYTVPYHCLEAFMGADNTTIPTLTRTSYWQMVVYQRDVVPGLLREEAVLEETVIEGVEMEEVEMEQAMMVEAVIDGVEMEQAEIEEAKMDEASSISVGSETSSEGISSGTVSSDGSSSKGLSSEGSTSQGVSSQGVSSQGVSSQGVSSQGSSFEGSSVEGPFVQGSSCDGPPPDGPPPDAPPPDGSSSESWCPPSECRISDGPPS